MKRNIKRLLASILICCSLLSLATPVMATDTTADPDTTVSVSTNSSEENSSTAGASDFSQDTDTPSGNTDEPNSDVDANDTVPGSATPSEPSDPPADKSETDASQEDTASDDAAPIELPDSLPADDEVGFNDTTDPDVEHNTDIEVGNTDTTDEEDDSSLDGAALFDLIDDDTAELLGIAVDNPASIEGIALLSNDIWAFYKSIDLGEKPNDSRNYIIHNNSFGIAIHRAYNSSEDKNYWAYCLDRYLGSNTSQDYGYTMKSLPNTPYYQVTKYAAALGYGNNSITRMQQMFGYTLNNTEAYQATQAAIWICQKVADGTYSTVNSAVSGMTIKLNPSHSDSDALNAAKAIANAALNLYNNGMSLAASKATLVSSNQTSATYRITITAKNCYGGYSATISGLTSSCSVTGSGNVTTSGVKSFSSTTANGTDTITIVLPKGTTSKTYSVTLNLKSYNQNYASNNSVLFADADSSSKQNFMVTGAGGLTPLSTTVSLSMQVDRLKNGRADITKKDAKTGEVVPGIVFALYEYSAKTNSYVNTGITATTNANGVASFTSMQYSADNLGRYRIFEAGTSKTHQVWTSPYVLFFNVGNGDYFYHSSAASDVSTKQTVSQNASGAYDFSFAVTAYDNPITGSLTMMKSDAETGKPLAGCTFELFERSVPTAWTDSGGTWVSTGKTAVTDSTGRAVFSNLTVTSKNVGKYQVREVSAPDGYEVDTSFQANIKLGTGYYQYSSMFTSTVSGWLKNGESATGSINGQTKTLVSAKSSSGGGFDFTVYMGDRHRVEWDAIIVYKLAKDPDGNTTYLSGTTFDLLEKQADGTWSKCCTLADISLNPGRYTIPKDDNGNPTYALQPGTTYKVVETAAPNGVINTGWESEEFVWAGTSDVEISYTCEDKIPTGAIQVKKTDAETGFPLAGLEFTVSAAEEISYTLNGQPSVLYQKGETIGTMTTGADGTASMDDLYYGSYLIKETSPLPNYKLEDVSFTAVVGAPEGYDSSNTYPESAAIGVTVYSGIATVTDYEEYHAAEHAKYVKDSDGYVIRYNRNADGTYTPAPDGSYAEVEYASVTNAPLHPKMAVAKLTDRTTDPQGGAVDFDAETGRYTEDKIPGTYFNGQTVTFTLTATNTGNVDLYNLYMMDVMSDSIWTVVENRDPQNTDSDVRTTDVTFRTADGTELAAGSTVETTLGNTVTITGVTYNDVSRAYIIDFDQLAADDSVSFYMTFTLYNYDNVNKNALPNDVYLFGQYLNHGTSGDLTDVPGGGEDEYDCHDKDAINVVALGSITIHKTNTDGQAVEGADFQLTDKNGTAVQFVLLEDGSYAATVTAENGDWVPAAQSGKDVTDNLISDKNGTIELTALPFGEYDLTELQTASSYTLLEEPIHITLPYTVVGAEDTSSDDVFYVPGTDGNGVNYYYHLTYDISNSAAFRLPATGGTPILLWLTAAGCLMSGISIILFGSQRKKRRNKNPI